MELTAEEIRVLGVLVEKEATTPEQYPLSTNALTTACNQKTSREPVVSYDQRTVSQTILQNVRVLAIDQAYAPAVGETEESTRIGQTATLEVTPEEAELVALSQSKGDLSLALRPLDEMAVAAARKPRLGLNGGDEGAGAVMIIRNSEPTLTAMGGN